LAYAYFGNENRFSRPRPLFDEDPVKLLGCQMVVASLDKAMVQGLLGQTGERRTDRCWVSH
jgi:hypothetical protein